MGGRLTDAGKTGINDTHDWWVSPHGLPWQPMFPDYPVLASYSNIMMVHLVE